MDLDSMERMAIDRFMILESHRMSGLTKNCILSL